MNAPKKKLLVSALILVDGKGKILLAQRPSGKSMAGLWEFPGGKVHENETLKDALIREIKEELGIVLKAPALTLAMTINHDY
ncbi:MAG: NUDIX domain-containing protein, partial [Sphingomonadales bacterium]